MNAMLPASRMPDHPVNPMFIARHSGRAFTADEISEPELLTLLEAARWAPSGANSQPTRLVWGRRGDPVFAAIAETLVPSNRLWAEKAAALVVVASVTHKTQGEAEVALPSHAFDAGAAWMSLALQSHLRGWMAHAMGGFDKAKAAEVLALTGAFQLHVVVAIGHQGTALLLPEVLREREVPSQRLPLAHIARNSLA
jgi:nitroreductase